MSDCGRAHTSVISVKQRGFLGAELARRRAGKGPRIPSFKTSDLVSHLEESGGKKLPYSAAAANRRRRKHG